MKINFHLLWAERGYSKKSFKSDDSFGLFRDYTDKISKFGHCQVFGANSDLSPRPARAIWLCDRTAGSTVMSSEALANSLRRLQTSGIRELEVVIGGPDGLSKKEAEVIKKPDLRWSFGTLTLPHELAAVVAAEQIYRAQTIIHNLPYHNGH